MSKELKNLRKIEFFSRLEEAGRRDVRKKIQISERKKKDPKYIYHGPKFSETRRFTMKFRSSEESSDVK